MTQNKTPAEGLAGGITVAATAQPNVTIESIQRISERLGTKIEGGQIDLLKMAIGCVPGLKVLEHPFIPGNDAVLMVGSDLYKILSEAYAKQE